MLYKTYFKQCIIFAPYVRFLCFPGLAFVLCRSGWQGCKNELRGGDTLRDVDEGPYFTYIVHMSWKRPSMQLRSLARFTT